MFLSLHIIWVDKHIVELAILECISVTDWIIKESMYMRRTNLFRTTFANKVKIFRVSNALFTPAQKCLLSMAVVLWLFICLWLCSTRVVWHNPSQCVHYFPACPTRLPAIIIVTHTGISIIQHRFIFKKLEEKRTLDFSLNFIRRLNCKYEEMSIWNWNIWPATWQNQQSDCVPSEDSDQPLGICPVW